MGALSDKTVLLVTHQVDFLPVFDSILVCYTCYPNLALLSFCAYAHIFQKQVFILKYYCFSFLLVTIK